MQLRAYDVVKRDLFNTLNSIPSELIQHLNLKSLWREKFSDRVQYNTFARYFKEWPGKDS